MSMFYLWNPYVQPDSRTLTFVLINSSVSGVAQDRLFIENVLQQLNLETEVADWTITPCRSKYHSEYLNEDDWHDIWQLIWKIQVEIGHPVSLPEMRLIPWIPVDPIGYDWIAEPDDGDLVNCLVIADFRSGAQLQRVQASIANNPILEQWQNRYASGQPTFSQMETLGKYKQLHINLGKFSGEFFAQGADYAEQVAKLCEQAKGTTHFEMIAFSKFDGVDE